MHVLRALMKIVFGFSYYLLSILFVTFFTVCITTEIGNIFENSAVTKNRIHLVFDSILEFVLYKRKQKTT